jgi:hypothetical protein
MKNISILTTSLIIFSLLFIKCDKSENSIDTKDYAIPEIAELPHLMKGYELYSWEENENWYFTLIAGTNKTKTFNEISAESQDFEENGMKITSNSIEELKNIISKLPDDELVFWLGEEWIRLAWGNNHNSIKLPSEDTQNDLLKYCNLEKVRLSIIE